MSAGAGTLVRSPQPPSGRPAKKAVAGIVEGEEGDGGGGVGEAVLGRGRRPVVLSKKALASQLEAADRRVRKDAAAAAATPPPPQLSPLPDVVPSLDHKSRWNESFVVGLSGVGGAEIIDCPCGINREEGPAIACSSCCRWVHLATGESSSKCWDPQLGRPLFDSVESAESGKYICRPCQEKEGAAAAAKAAASAAALSGAQRAALEADERAAKTNRLAFVSQCDKAVADFAALELEYGLLPPGASNSPTSAVLYTCNC